MNPRIAAFGHYLPERRLGNEALAARLGCEPAWILQSSGIEERRIAEESVVEMGIAAGLAVAGVGSHKPGLILVSSGTSPNRFPGPAAEIALGLGLPGIPAIDLPLASAGSLFGVALAANLARQFGDVLVIATEKMSAVTDAADKNTAILFGDGAGACRISNTGPGIEILDSVLRSDGTWAADIQLPLTGPLHMDGLSVIMQASRKIPSVITELLTRNAIPADAVRAYLMHQANQNLIGRVARALEVPSDRFYSNIRQYGNTSSASMLIAASEWFHETRLHAGDAVCFAGFGAGFHWGAVLGRWVAAESTPV